MRGVHRFNSLIKRFTSQKELRSLASESKLKCLQNRQVASRTDWKEREQLEDKCGNLERRIVGGFRESSN